MPSSADSLSHEEPIKSKVVLIGSTGVGKTSILMRHNGQGFSTQVSPTIGASYSKSEVKVEEGKVEMQIWDTAGQERFRAMAPMYYRNANAAFAIYDTSSTESFREMKEWVEELNRRCPEPPVLCVLGNKTDKKDDREVKCAEGEAYAEGVGALFFETSAFTGQCIEKAFKCLATEILKCHSEGRAVCMENSNGNVETEESSSRKRNRKCC
jgi:small GTP-binding protein